jgi:hypothetical protein
MTTSDSLCRCPIQTRNYTLLQRRSDAVTAQPERVRRNTKLLRQTAMELDLRSFVTHVVVEDKVTLLGRQLTKTLP